MYVFICFTSLNVFVHYSAHVDLLDVPIYLCLTLNVLVRYSLYLACLPIIYNDCSFIYEPCCYVYS